MQVTIDQLAFVAHEDKDHDLIKEELNIPASADWSVDFVRAKGVLLGEKAENYAKLSFFYGYGIELEILQYLEGANYCEYIPAGRQCHIGSHAIGPYAREDIILNAPVVQSVVTQEHTNPAVTKAERRYRYTIYDTSRLLGSYFKVIERLHVSDADRVLEELYGELL